MKNIMEILKAHGISIAAGLVIIASVVFAFMGASSEAVVQAMNERRDEIGAGSIGGLRGDPKNDAIIAAEEARVKKFQDEYKQTIEAAKQINLKRPPLLEGVFPKPVNAEVKFRFDEAYKAAIRRLPAQLEAGTLPNEADLAEERQNVEEAITTMLEKEEEERTLRGEDSQPNAAAVENPFGNPFPPPQPPPVPGGPGGGRDFQPGFQPGFQPNYQSALPANLESQLTPEQKADPKFDVVFRARVAKARSIRCYIDDVDVREPVNTFDVSPIYQSQTPPTDAEMWTAQLSLWIQQDVVEAIRTLNEQAAASIDEPHVEHMPVKRLSSIRISGYQGVASEALPFGMGERGLSGSQDKVETTLSGLTPNEQYDIVRFKVVCVVDQRDIIRLIDAISRQNFYQCVNVKYQVVDRAAEQAEGFMYGIDPVVRLTLEVEGYFLREVYVPLMPDAVRTALKIEGAEEDSGG